MKDIDKSIAINPEEAEAYNNRGLVKAKLNNYNEALKDFERAIEINPHHSNAINNRDLAKKKLNES